MEVMTTKWKMEHERSENPLWANLIRQGHLHFLLQMTAAVS